MQHTCTQCHTGFEVTDDDLVFYDKVSPVFNGKKELISPPTLCPLCRMQRRSAWRNERSFHVRNCDLCKKRIVSLYGADSVFPVYCHSCWWSDQWDPKGTGQDYDLSRPFMDQFSEVNHRTPHLVVMNDNGVTSENCEYTQDFTMGKNCYMCAGGWYAQDCYYCGGNFLRVQSVIDSYFPIESELCYECLDVRHLYNCQYVQNAENCRDCMFGYDLRGCNDCFGCTGLRQKQYYWFNQPLTKEEYASRRSAFQSGSYAAIHDAKNTFAAILIAAPRRGMQLTNCEDCTGDYLFHCKDVHDSYMVFNAQHSRFCDKGEGQLWSYDILHTGNSQYCYENLTPDNSWMTHFSMWCWVCKETLYSDNCHNSEHLFGCTSMKQSKYCILNKQYSQKEYETLVPKIIERMRKDAEWGELAPMTRSPFGYNETMANDYFPLPEKEVLSRSWPWKNLVSDKKDGIHADGLPDSISDVSDDILHHPILCQRTGRAFRIVKQELDFYRTHQIPLPRLHPTERHADRFGQHNSPKIWRRSCAKCSEEIQTTYSPEQPEIVYCDHCYLETVY